MPIQRALPQLGYYLLSYGLLRGLAVISLVHVIALTAGCSAEMADVGLCAAHYV